MPATTDNPSDIARVMYSEAQKHGDRFLLPRHFHRHRELEKPEWKAAEWLVNHGFARWISVGSTFYPGIELTGKPLQ